MQRSASDPDLTLKYLALLNQFVMFPGNKVTGTFNHFWPQQLIIEKLKAIYSEFTLKVSKACWWVKSSKDVPFTDNNSSPICIKKDSETIIKKIINK